MTTLLPLFLLLVQETPADVSTLLEEVRTEHGLPALVAAVVSSDELLAQGVAGVRVAGGEDLATLEDRWHLGSITKSFTSTLTAVLVADGQLSWEDTLGEHLEEARGTAFEPVRLAMLANHTSGMVANADFAWFEEFAGTDVPMVDQRLSVVGDLLATEPLAPPGEGFTYSNAGYVTLGCVLETTTGEPWEELMRTHVLAPLGLATAGFGAPGAGQPEGHVPGAGEKLVSAGPDVDNPRWLGPAGTLHMSIGDAARYAREHLAGERGGGEVLDAEAYRALHRHSFGTYARGWIDQPEEWAGGARVIWHNGSNTMWYALLALVPEHDRAFVLVSNGGIGSRVGVDAAVARLAELWLECDAKQD